MTDPITIDSILAAQHEALEAVADRFDSHTEPEPDNTETDQT